MTEQRLPQLTAILAAWNLILGGGLFTASVALMPFGNGLLSYAARSAVSMLATGIAVLSFVAALVLLKREADRGLQSLPVLPVLAGILSVTSVIVVPGVVGYWRPKSLVVSGGVGLLLVVCGLAISRHLRWGGYVELLALAGGAAYLATDELNRPLSVILLVVLFGFVPPAVSSQSGSFEANGYQGWARWTLFPLRALSDLLFVMLMTFSLILWSWATIGGRGLADAVQRSNQRRAASDIHYIRTVVEKYAEIHKHYPKVRNLVQLGLLMDSSYFPEWREEKVLPQKDPWGGMYEYHRVVRGSVEGYVIRTAGADGAFEHADPTAYRGEATNGFERDMVLSTLGEAQWPEGFMTP